MHEKERRSESGIQRKEEHLEVLWGGWSQRSEIAFLRERKTECSHTISEEQGF